MIYYNIPQKMYIFIILGIIFKFFGKLNGCIYLTVSSLPPDKLEINWYCDKPIQSLSVLGQDPNQQSNLEPLATIYPIDHPQGFRKTNITFNPHPLPGGWSRTHDGPREIRSFCLYWIQALFDDQSSYVDCIKIQPAWMFENKAGIKKLSLPQMFIPGTHNSGSDAMRIAKKRSISHLDNLVLTQDQSVWNQLVFGIRFLDFRIGYYPQVNDPKLRFWINHDLVRIQPLVPVLKDIIEFSKSSPEEIIILDFHRFPAGFRTKNAPNIHKELIDLLQTELNDMIIPRPPVQMKLKLEDIWNTNKRIVLCYNHENFVWESPWLWNGVTHRWGNKQTAESLENFLDNAFKDIVTRKLWAAMAELTPTPLDFLSNGSLRSMADNVNHLLTTWFVNKQNWTSRANIVAADYFLGTNLVNLTIQENINRGKQATK